MHLRVAFGLFVAVMMADVIVARPEPLPMFLANRAIKSAGIEVKKADQNMRSTSVIVGDSVDTVSTKQISNGISKTNNDEVSPVETLKVPCAKDHVVDVPATSDLISGLPVAPKLDVAAASQIIVEPTELNNPVDLPVASKLKDTVASQIGVDQTELNSSIDNVAIIGDVDLANNSEAASVLDRKPSEDNKDQVAFTEKKLLMKKAPKAKKSKKINKVASLDRVRLLDSLIDFLFDSLIPTNDEIKRSRSSRAFDEFFDYAFPSSPYEFNYF